MKIIEVFAPKISREDQNIGLINSRKSCRYHLGRLQREMGNIERKLSITPLYRHTDETSDIKPNGQQTISMRFSGRTSGYDTYHIKNAHDLKTKQLIDQLKKLHKMCIYYTDREERIEMKIKSD